jgi:teichuronic acid biosynthesis glycosyltransferase TuaG
LEDYKKVEQYMEPEISVIIPTYNAGLYIKQCIESVLKQKSSNIEIIVVDDCSTDHTRDIVMQFDSKIVNYICLDENFGGPSKPRNIGVTIAKGQFLIMLDADDLLINNSIDRRVDILKSDENLAFVFCDGIRFSGDTADYDHTFHSKYPHLHKILFEIGKKSPVKIPSLKAYRGLAKGDFILPSGLAVRKSVYEEVGRYDESVTNGQDLDMSLRIVDKFPVAYLDIIGFKQRVHNESISAQGHKLIEHKMTLLKKNLSRSSDIEANNSFKNKIAENYISLGYFYKKNKNYKLSITSYSNSLSYTLSLTALRGLFACSILKWFS